MTTMHKMMTPGKQITMFLKAASTCTTPFPDHNTIYTGTYMHVNETTATCKH